MAEAAQNWRDHVEEPDVSQVVTEDDEPVDLFVERQQKLLSDSLEASYSVEEPIVALVNVGLFGSPDEPPLVPDLLLSLGVVFPEDHWEKKNRSYFVWRYGKPPELVVEVVSNREGGELTDKLQKYQRLHVSYYAVYDPGGFLGKRSLRLFESRGASLVERADPFSAMEDLGLRLALWEGEYAQFRASFLRFANLSGELLATAGELAERASARAEQERERADRLAEKLRELGIDPDSMGTE